MKQSLLTLAALLCTAIAALAAPKRILVNTPEEFINALGSNREIVVCSEEGILLTPTLTEMVENGKLKQFDRWSRAKQEGILYEPDTDGPQLVLSGFKNLTITSNSDSRLSIEVTPRYVNVLTFISCENITLTNLYFGHTKEGTCSNGVLAFDDCHNISIKNCGLFGCGTEGIEMHQSENFTMTDSEIFHCSYHIMHILGSKNCKFINCAFYENRQYDQVTINADCENILFDHCVFTKNQGCLFTIGTPEQVKLRRCIIQHDDDEGNAGESDENSIFIR